MNSEKYSSLRAVDLFSGCGGFSRGAHNAGIIVNTAYDNDPVLSSSYKRNFPASKVMVEDITRLCAEKIIKDVGGDVDIVFGGPPCQGFSSIGKRDINDPRRLLLNHFFRLVKILLPRVFIMENVVGLAYENSIELLEKCIGEVSSDYLVYGPFVLNAADYGAATKRSRLFVVGVKRSENKALSNNWLDSSKAEPSSVRDAIEDIAYCKFLGEEDGFDKWSVSSDFKFSEYASKLISENNTFTGHRFTKHSEKVVERFSAVEQGSIDRVGRHPRLSWDGQCPTLRAGTGSDKGSFQSVRPLHPIENRVITVREAARLQGFPDAHDFHPTIWHSFRMIGNSVSPVMSEAIFKALIKSSIL